MAERILQIIAEQKKRLTIAQINKNTAEEARAYYNLAEAYYLASDFHQQIEYLKQYLSIAEEVGDRAGARRPITSSAVLMDSWVTTNEE